ncbi:MAG TPA: MFS transporter [Stackebrandtia sp.]|jgi:EmrB/QacA subfamily drug resistance transporter|uniref:MFS transporter n=1 Tax=Stackebrandtia sp. TaxID=2023065 RepID=UPI002D747D19|nr:MFS transporter [Stackebrandtia sp.]HZE40201.1 MFS transporter [Stackebrandtia sp.]
MSSPASIQAETPPEGHPRRWFILGVLVLSLIVVVLDNTVLNVAMKTIADPKDGLGASQSQLEWAVNSYTLVFAGLLFTFGVIGDRVGRKRMAMIGLVLFGLTSVASAFAQDPTQLILARAGMGIGAAAIMPSTLSILTNVFAPKDRGRAIGIWSGAVGIGIAIGPIIGGTLLEHFWWGSVFLINAPVVLVALLAIGFVAPESRNPLKTKIDVVGVLLSIAGLVTLTYGIIEGGDTGDWSLLKVWGPTAGGVILLVAFVLYERMIEFPALDVRLFKERRFSSASAVVALVFFAGMGLMFFMTFYIQIIKNFSPLQTGLLFLPFAGAMLIFSPLSSVMVKRFGPKATATAGMTAITLAFTGYLLLDADTPVWVMGVMFFVQGAGMANVMPPAMNTIMGSLPREKAGVGSAVGNTLRQVGGSIGVAVLGSVLAQLYRSSITPKLPDGMPHKHDVAESIASSYGAAQQIAHSGAPGAAQLSRQLMDNATDAFISAMHTTAIVSASVGVVGILVALILFPRKDRGTGPGGAHERADEAAQGSAEPVLIEA